MYYFKYQNIIALFLKIELAFHGKYFYSCYKPVIGSADLFNKIKKNL